MEVNAISFETHFAPVGMFVTCPAKTGTIDNRVATTQLLDNPATECANQKEFALAQQNPGNQEAPLSKLAGTDGPSHLRTIAGLIRRVLPCEGLDKGGGSNRPGVVAALPCPALEMPCKRIKFIDRNVHLVYLGSYHLNSAIRYKVARWLTRRQKESIDQRLACWLALAAACLVMFPGGLS